MNIDEIQVFFPQAVVIGGGSLSPTIEIQCPNCSAWNYWQDWIANWIDLVGSKFGINPRHLRMECPNCNEIYDHRTSIEGNWVVRDLG